MKPVTEMLDGFTLDTPVPLEWLAWIVGGMGLVFFWHMFRQARAARRSWLLPFLWLLRMGAVIALAAMVTGPSKTQTERQTTRQAVTILVDTSGSMSRQEPPEHSLEWEKPREQDATAGALHAAIFHLQSLERLPVHQLGSHLGIERLNDAATALHAAALHDEAKALQSLATEFDQARSVVMQEARNAVSQTLTSVRAAVAKILLFAPPVALVSSNVNESGVRRLARVADWLEQGEKSWIEECRKTFDVSVVDAGTRAQWRERTLENGPQSTDLAALLDEAGRAATLSHSRAVVLVSDGAHNAARSPEEAAARLRGLPVVWVPIGARLANEAKDLALAQVTAPRSVLLHGTIEIEPRLSAAGCEGENVDIVLREGDREVDRQQVRIVNGTAEKSVVFHWKPPGLGAHKLSVEAVPLKGETFTDNNHQALPIEVLDDRLRLIVADREPRWETRYLLNLLKRDERMAFSTMLAAPQWSPVGKELPRPSLPTTVDAWAQNRVIILGDVRPDMLDAARQEALSLAVVERGCTLILVAGSEAMPAAFAGQKLEPLLPVTHSPVAKEMGFAVHVSEEGKTMPVTQLADSPDATDALWQRTTKKLPLFNYTPWSVPKPQATVLLTAESLEDDGTAVKRAFLSFHDVGKGRVVFLAAPASWHLRYAEGDSYHFRFWSQLIHWAVSRDMETGSRCVQLALEDGVTTLKQDAPAKVLLTMRDLLGEPVGGATSQAVVQQHGKEVKTAPFEEDPAHPGRYSATFASLPVGALTVTARGDQLSDLLKRDNRQGTVELALNVAPTDNREQREALSDITQLRRLAAASEGALLPPYAVPAMLQNLGLRPSIVEHETRLPLWNEWRWLWLVLGLLALEWSLRRFAGVL